MNFKDFRTELNQLKKIEKSASFDYLLANLGSGEEKYLLSVLELARYDLEQFRNRLQ